MIITATFIGQDGSLGYRAGYRYALRLSEFATIMIQRPDGTGVCEYKSLSAFLRNWDLVHRVTPQVANIPDSSAPLSHEQNKGWQRMIASLDGVVVDHANQVKRERITDTRPNFQEARSFRHVRDAVYDLIWGKAGGSSTDHHALLHAAMRKADWMEAVMLRSVLHELGVDVSDDLSYAHRITVVHGKNGARSYYLDRSNGGVADPGTLLLERIPSDRDLGRMRPGHYDICTFRSPLFVR